MIKLFEIWGYIGLAIFFVTVVIGYFVLLWCFFKCMGVRECNNRKCKFRNCCFRYKEKLTEEEAKELLKLLDSYH